MSQEKVAAVVLAGGTNSPEMVAATGVTNRALVTLGEKRMLDYVIDALAQSQRVTEIYVAGDVPQDARYTQIPQGESVVDNLFGALRAAEINTPNLQQVLVVTSDIPFVTAEGIDDFVTQSLALQADLCYPIIPMEIYQKRFSQMKRTTLKLKEGRFTGGNIMLLNAAVILGQRETIMKAYAARKKVAQIGGMLGWGLLVRIILSQTLSPSLLSIPPLEAGVSRILGAGCRARAVVTRYPEIGTDVDKPEDIAAARALLAPA